MIEQLKGKQSHAKVETKMKKHDNCSQMASFHSILHEQAFPTAGAGQQALTRIWK